MCIRDRITGKGFRSFEPGRAGIGAKDPDTSADEIIGKPGDKRCLRAAHHQINIMVTGKGNNAIMVSGVEVNALGHILHPRISRGDHQPGQKRRPVNSINKGMFAATTADNKNVHGMTFPLASELTLGLIWLIFHNMQEQNSPPNDGNRPVWTLGDLSQALKKTVESVYDQVRVKAEVSQPKRAASGHVYFTLKDDSATLDAVCWKGVAAQPVSYTHLTLPTICTV